MDLVKVIQLAGQLGSAQNQLFGLGGRLPY